MIFFSVNFGMLCVTQILLILQVVKVIAFFFLAVCALRILSKRMGKNPYLANQHNNLKLPIHILIKTTFISIGDLPTGKVIRASLASMFVVGNTVFCKYHILCLHLPFA